MPLAEYFIKKNYSYVYHFFGNILIIMLFNAEIVLTYYYTVKIEKCPSAKCANN